MSFVNIGCILFIINMFVGLILAICLYSEYENKIPLFCQQVLCELLDDYNINRLGKLILCILITTFTILYTCAVGIAKIGMFIRPIIWDLFCQLFQKK